MKLLSTLLPILFAASTHAHSWVDCVSIKVPNYKEAKANPQKVRPIHNCVGYPRNKALHDKWIEESTHYSWNLNLNRMDKDKKILACNPSQTNKYPDNRPMTTAKPGEEILMRHWGNGHTRWDIGLPNHKDPGLVRIYWKGEKEKEIYEKSELTEVNWMKGAQANFSADAISIPAGARPDDIANYMHLKLPENIENGRHMMVWTWASDRGLQKNKDGWKKGDYDKEWQDSWSTCFDIMIKDSKHKGPTYSAKDKEKLAAEDKKSSNAICVDQECRKGGQKTATCKGENCPPCRLAQAGGVDCYEYANGKCPFGGMYDCKLKKQL